MWRSARRTDGPTRVDFLRRRDAAIEGGLRSPEPETAALSFRFRATRNTPGTWPRFPMSIYFSPVESLESAIAPRMDPVPFEALSRLLVNGYAGPARPCPPMFQLIRAQAFKNGITVR